MSQMLSTLVVAQYDYYCYYYYYKICIAHKFKHARVGGADKLVMVISGQFITSSVHL